MNMRFKLASWLAALLVIGSNGLAQTVTPSTKPLERPPQPAPAPAAAPVPADRFQRIEPGPTARPVVPPGAPQDEGLSDEQKAKLKEANEKLRLEQQPLYGKQREVRNEMRQLEQADPLDEAKLREKALELGKVEGELAILRAKHFQTIKGLLPKEQVERLQSGPGGARFGSGPAPLPTVRPGPAVPRDVTQPAPVNPRPKP